MKTLSRSALTLFMALAVMTATAQPQKGCMATPEQKAKQSSQMITKKLGLSEAQEKQVYELRLAMATSCPQHNMTRDEKPTQEQRETMRAEMSKQHESFDAGLKNILTTEQYTKWETVKAERMNNAHGKQGMHRNGKHGKNNATTCGYNQNCTNKEACQCCNSTKECPKEKSEQCPDCVKAKKNNK